MDLINQINLGSKFMRPIKSINRFIQAHSNVYQKKKKKKPSNCKHSYTLKKLRGSWQRRMFFLVEFWA